MSFVAAAIAGSALVGAGAGIYSANKAAGAQSNAANNAIQAQQQMFQQGQQAAQNEISPFVNFGQSQLPTLNKLLTPGANMNDTLEQMPGFKFAFDWGNKGITNQATSSGLGGNALQAGAKFSEGLAQNSYGTIVDNLLKGAGIGSGPASAFAGNVMQGATQTGQGVANSLIGAGNAQAGADIATGNAVTGGANSLTNAFTLNALTGGKLFGGGGMYGANTGVKGINP